MRTIIWRHRRENLKKCSLRGLEGRDDLLFLQYPRDPLPDLSGYLTLALDAPPLTEADREYGLFLIDGTWRYAGVMVKQLQTHTAPPTIERSIPSHFKTAYPRRQDDCDDPSRGLASVEALYIAHKILGRGTDGLLDHYHWKEEFIAKNFDQK